MPGKCNRRLSTFSFILSSSKAQRDIRPFYTLSKCVFQLKYSKMSHEMRILIKRPAKKKVGYEVEKRKDGFYYGRSN